MATITTGLSKAKRREIARKTRRTKRANPSIGRKALRKRRKALLKRKAFGL
jgi:gp68 prohead core protein